MNIFSFRDRLIADYTEYVKSFMRFDREDLRKFVEEALAAGALWREACERAIVGTLLKGATQVRHPETSFPVIHYDLSWNPTRHEQREGRVDRYGQKSKKIRVITYYGLDNQVDGIVLDILLRKHKAIRTDRLYRTQLDPPPADPRVRHPEHNATLIQRRDR